MLLDVLRIDAGKGIGYFKLGMSKEDVKECIEKYNTQYGKPNTSTYFEFNIRYNPNGLVTFIELPFEYKDTFHCLFQGIDVFNTKAEDLVKLIDEISNYDRSNTESETCFTFPELGLILWREDVLKEEDLETEWFKELPPYKQEEKMKDLYFNSVSIQEPKQV